MEQNIRVTVNGIEQQSSVEPRMLLVQYLREALNLTGTHVGCDTGQCGACTVLLNGQPVKSCMVLAVQADGAQVQTVEGLKAERAISPDSGRLLGEARIAMRLLHTRHDDGGGGAASAQPESHRRRDSRTTRRQSLPLHRLSEYRRRRTLSR